MLLEDEKGILSGFSEMSEEERENAISAFAGYAAEHVPTAGNMRGSEEYRTLLVKVLTKRALKAAGGMKDED